jgi:excisionase family DNA binding protein
MDVLVSVEEAARRLGGISKWTVHSWLSQGRLQRVKVGSRTMIRESELLKMIDDGSDKIKRQMSELSNRDFVKPSEAARLLSVPLRLVYDLIRSGKMRPDYDTGRWRIPASEIEARLKQRGQL